MRIGHGYDVHKLIEGRKCIIGGVDIPSPLGLLGHSDADVLLHAVSDALLGACAMGDIGHLFPDTDDKWKGADSLELLKEVGDAVNQRIVDAHGNHHCAAGYAGDDVGKPNHHAFEDVNEEFHAFHSLIYWKGFSENHHTMICRS